MTNLEKLIKSHNGTNVGKTLRIADAMQYNAIIQILFVDAIEGKIDAILEDEEKTMKLMQKHLIHPEAWINAAKEVRHIMRTDTAGEDIPY